MLAADAATPPPPKGWWLPVLTLSACWALAFAVLTSGAASVNLAGAALTDTSALSSFPLAFISFTSGIYNLVLPIEIRTLGRYRTYLLGACVGVLGCIVSWAGMLVGSLAVLLTGAVFIGVGLSHSQNYRFGVLLCVPEAQHPVAISWVLAGGVVGAVLGPEYSKHTRFVIEGVPYGGTVASTRLLLRILLHLHILYSYICTCIYVYI